MKLHAALLQLFRDALRRGRGCVAVASSARRRGVRVVLGCICGTLVFAACTTARPAYRACLHLHPQKKPSITIHVPGWIVAEHEHKAAAQFDFVADARPDETLHVTCTDCFSTRCQHVAGSLPSAQLTLLEVNQ